MDGAIIAVVTVLLIVVGALFLNWEIRRQERKDVAPAAGQVQAKSVPSMDKAA